MDTNDSHNSSYTNCKYRSFYRPHLHEETGTALTAATTTTTATPATEATMPLLQLQLLYPVAGSATSAAMATPTTTATMATTTQHNCNNFLYSNNSYDSNYS